MLKSKKFSDIKLLAVSYQLSAISLQSAVCSGQSSVSRWQSVIIYQLPEGQGNEFPCYNIGRVYGTLFAPGGDLVKCRLPSRFTATQRAGSPLRCDLLLCSFAPLLLPLQMPRIWRDLRCASTCSFAPLLLCSLAPYQLPTVD